MEANTEQMHVHELAKCVRRIKIEFVAYNRV